jgi:hypothetical protein
MATLDRYRLSSFTVDVQDAAVLASLRNGAKRQSYAIANAINTTLLAVQASVPKHLRKQGFVIRKPKFFFGGRGMRGGVANYISDFANAKRGKIWGRIDAGSSNPGTARRLLLGQFEDGGARKPMTPGARAVAVPLLGRPARPNVAQGVVPAYTFAGLKFRKFVNGQEVKRKRRGRKEAASGFFGEYGRLQLNRVIGDSSVQWKGALRTFILPKSRNAPHGGVFQRVGRGRGAVREIYSFVQNPQLPAMLKFKANAQNVADQWFRIALRDEVRRTLQHQASRSATA